MKTYKTKVFKETLRLIDQGKLKKWQKLINAEVKARKETEQARANLPENTFK